MNEQQKQFIIESYATMDVKEIAETIGVSPYKIYKFASEKKIKKETVRSNSKTSEEQRVFILNNYATMSNKEISYITKLDVKTIINFARLNGIKKNKAFRDNSNIHYDKRKFIIKNASSMTSSEMSEILNIPAYKIAAFCESANLEIKPHDGIVAGGDLTVSQKRFIRDNYKTMTNQDICERLGMSPKKLNTYAKNSKLLKDIEFKKTKPHYIELLQEKRLRDNYDVLNYLGGETEPMVTNLYKSKFGKYKLNQEYFSCIDNEFKAYWLGFLYADGCVRICKREKNKSVNSLEVALASVDRGHLEKLKKSLQSDHEILEKTIRNKYKASKLTFHNKNICEDLNTLGCVPNKSLILKFPTENQVPRYLIRHFIRGYFDGDGSIHINLEKRNIGLSFIGTEQFLKYLMDILCKEVCISEVSMYKKKDNEAYSIMWGDASSVEKIYKYLYKDCNIYLERKLKKFDILYCLD